MRFTQEQLQSFFGTNVDVSTLPAAITSSNNAESLIITIFFIMFAVIFMINITKWTVKKIVEYKKEQTILSSSKELVTYSENQSEDKKANHTKQNIYNKYYFNVYVKQPYSKNSKQNNYNKKSNFKYQRDINNAIDDIIDAEMVL